MSNEPFETNDARTIRIKDAALNSLGLDHVTNYRELFEVYDNLTDSFIDFFHADSRIEDHIKDSYEPFIQFLKLYQCVAAELIDIDDVK